MLLLLMGAGADFSSRLTDSQMNFTPLHLAVMHERLAMIKQLKDENIELKSIDGKWSLNLIK